MDDEYAVSLERIPDYQTVCMNDDGSLREDTQLLIHTAEVIGVPKLNEDTLDTWTTRIKILKTSNTSIAIFGNEDWWPSEYMLKRHFGMSLDIDFVPDVEFDEWLVRVIRRRAKNEELARHLH